MRSTKRKPLIDGKKHCYRCDRFLETSCFYPDKMSASRLSSRCRECSKADTTERHNNNLEYYFRQMLHKSTFSNRTKKRIQLYAGSSMTVESLLDLWHQQNGKCAVTQVPMTHIRGQGFRVLTNVSIDRVNNDLGYQDGNVRLVCKAVNYMKNVMSDRELVQWSALVLAGPLSRTNY